MMILTSIVRGLKSAILRKDTVHLNPKAVQRPMSWSFLSQCVHTWGLSKRHCNSKKRWFLNQQLISLRSRGHSQINKNCIEDLQVRGVHKETGGAMLLIDLHKSCTQELTAAGVPEPQESVDLIVAYVCGKKMIHEVDLNVKVSQKTVSDIQMMCIKRLQRVPVPFIIGEWDFLEMTLNMEPGILIPRPETEELALLILEELMQKATDCDYKALDIGCGSGALSLYLLYRLTKMRCVALDKSENACNLTTKNAEVYSLQDRLQVVNGDIFDKSCTQKLIDEGPFDLIVSNPPYIPAKDMDNLEQEVVGFEDFDALCGGSEGLDVIRQILSVARKLLKPITGVLWLEVDLSHPTKIENIIEENPRFGLKYITTADDFTKRGRFCKLQMSS